MSTFGTIDTITHGVIDYYSRDSTNTHIDVAVCVATGNVRLVASPENFGFLLEPNALDDLISTLTRAQREAKRYHSNPAGG